MGGVGIELRMDILRRAADQQILKPLQTHGWAASVTAADTGGEYLVISATKSGVTRKLALMYTSATDNRYYKRLDEIVDQIFVNGALYMVDSFAFGISTPVSPIDDFFPVLVDWNKQVAPEVVAPTGSRKVHGIRHITAERPVDEVWAHLTQLGSVKLAGRLVARRAVQESADLSSEQLQAKSAGVAYAIRNAADYFRGAANESLNRRILSIYYGSLALAFAEMLASPKGAADLDEVEGMTKHGHGLFTVPSATDDLGALHIGVLATGFFPRWVAFLGYGTDKYPRAKPKTPSDLENITANCVTTLGELLSTLPELESLFLDVYDLEPSWVAPVFDMESNHLGQAGVVGSSYVRFVDKSARLSEDRLRMTNWPIAELARAQDDVGQRHVFRARVDHSGFDFWYEVLPIHHSPFTQTGTLILPVLAGIHEYRAICLVILYALSILVRYMPSAWRRVEGGDWDQHSALIVRMLEVFERMLPQEFLESITDDHVHASLPGGFF
ncbi:hypothetical protein KZJ38_21465 [Paraburkholderia edwinii]|uniref:YaaC-like protein n=2 Tax=Paraburkholderia edwinii TaxID=2861782 RepID=A0ABX8UQ67_9BURK|nr:hypothetical protein KZJ38_21465 [Paraburkholderia edwinii]